MLKLKWNTMHIVTNQQANDVFALFRKQPPTVAAFDTETTGLHIILDKPFLFQFGWYNEDTMQGYAYAVDIERQPNLSAQVIKVWHILVKKHVKTYLGHNVKFDLHQLINIGMPYDKENVSDTMFYIRFAHDNLQPKEGGPPLGLKAYAARYIDAKAKLHEKKLDVEKTEKAKHYNNLLVQRLQKCKLPEGTKYKSFRLSVIKEMFKDPIAEVDDFPEDIKQAYLSWKAEDLPLYLQNKVTQLVESNMIRYDTLNRENVVEYAIYDIVWTIEVYVRCAPVLEARKQQRGLEIENSLIFPLLEMERVGFKTDKQYLEESRIKLKAYIQQQREKLFELTSQEFTVGQHALIKGILNDDFDVGIDTTNATELDLVVSRLIIANPDDSAISVIKLVQELRTLEKWYSAYIIRFLKDLSLTDRLYTSINQVGAVSGRVTSSFQQFPRDPIKTVDGEELFYPRRMVQVTGEIFDGMIYCDYSQIELRFQAMYTILVGHPDLNLCRAYMPYKCHHKVLGAFNYNNPEHIKRWNEDWYLDEDPETKWIPTDVHGATTTAATGLKPGDPEFKHARSDVGKRTNFAKNYGAQYKKIREMFPHKTEEECRRIDNAYYTAFPGVREYHNYCYTRAFEAATVNLFGVWYYNASGHKLINLLIQGSAAYYLKLKIRALYEYSKANNVKSKFQMNIHDELSWEKHKDELEVFFEFQNIMQQWEDALVPIVAEMDATNTTWAAKKEVHSLEDLQVYFRN